ncbi:MAG: HAMP domain-containing histidine kinase [Deltaproteobacteria bacterium]|jgi:signal transduction histidine kinase|nr:HAMP domain-containing histidine kinase [Deltaproteobacteria bacterium]
MKKVILLLATFFICLTAPMSYLVVRTFQGIEHEERTEFRYFTESLFDRIEEDLARIVIREESRPVDHYSTPGPDDANASRLQQSSLAGPPREEYVLGYFQNNPDGSLLSPRRIETKQEYDSLNLNEQLETLNVLFNKKKAGMEEPIPEPEEEVAAMAKPAPAQEQSLASRYFAPAERQKQKRALGQEEKRLEEVSFAQVQRLAQADKLEDIAPTEKERAAYRAPAAGTATDESATTKPRWTQHLSSIAGGRYADKTETLSRKDTAEPSAPQPTFQVEITPLQSIFLDNEHIFIFRRIGINNQIYRQGFVIQLQKFLADLLGSHFSNQPMTRFANLQLTVLLPDAGPVSVQGGTPAASLDFVLERRFPRPFSFLTATLRSDSIPHSSGRRTLQLLVWIIGGVTLLGFLAIYKSVRVVVDLSERRAGFVSSVTHELKTPLTNIKMYSEMLDQEIAPDRQREQEYFKVMNSESSRLARLIDNVLEFAKLERKQRPLNIVSGTFEEVLDETESIMQEKLKQEDFDLVIENKAGRPFSYDREVMVQILINLLENSIKFGGNATEKQLYLRIAPEGKFMNISVADSGPGIDPAALGKVFDDFYREDNSLTRRTKGTGIGLALVKKFVLAMGGKVTAANNRDAGCTITVSLPL